MGAPPILPHHNGWEGGAFHMKRIYSLPCLKGAVCSGGTRLPPTEPTGDIGTTIRWWRDMSFLEMMKTVRGASPPAPLCTEILSQICADRQYGGNFSLPYLPPAADARLGQNSCSSKLITAPSESSAVSRSLGLKRHAK